MESISYGGVAVCRCDRSMSRRQRFMHYMTTTKPGLVLLAGELRNFPILPERWAFIAAADGGARHALQQNVRPDYVIGDFDSLSDEELARLSAAGVPCARLPRDKDLTDGEAALQWADRKSVV